MLRPDVMCNFPSGATHIQAASPISVFVAQSSDRPIARAGLCQLLKQCPHLVVVGEAGEGEAARQKVAEAHPDVIVLDTFECDSAAMNLLAGLADASCNSRLLLLTACTSAAAQQLAISHGALGIVRHEQDVETLFKAIKCIHGGEIWLERSLAATVLQKKSRAPRPSTQDPHFKIATLTVRETEVIDLVCHGLKNQAIAEKLFISEAAVRHRLTSIFEKLHITDRLELVIFAYRHGLVEMPR